MKTFDFTIEELSMNAWPALQTIFYDGWIIRLANAYGNRANSINVIYPSKIELEEKINYCENIFSKHNLLPGFKLVGSACFKTCAEHRTLDERLKKRNYRIIQETSLQTCKITEPGKTNCEGIIVKNNFDSKWVDSVIKYNCIEGKDTATFRKMLKNIMVEKIVVSKKIGDEIIGCGYGAIERDYVGVFDIVVKEEFRGKGYGREIVETILIEAAKRGVKNSYLQVLVNNNAAQHLYGKMGYREIYRYWYRKKGNGEGAAV